MHFPFFFIFPSLKKIKSCRSINELIENNDCIILYDFEFPINHTKEDCEYYCELPEEITRMLEHESRVIHQHQEPVETINLGTEHEKNEIKINFSLKERNERS